MSQVPPPPSDPLGQPTSTGPTTPAAQSYNAPGAPPPPAYGQPQPYGQPGAPQPASNPFGNAPANENRVILGIIAIVLGGLGVHKFMMGHIVPGVILLLVTVLGSWIFCLGPFAASIIGIIEGIIYLTKTDEQFRQEYVVGRKQWF